MVSFGGGTALAAMLSCSEQMKLDHARLKQMTKDEMANRYAYHEPKEGQAEKYEAIRNLAKTMAEFVDEVCPESREKSLALTNLEQAVMWANASIARRE